MIPSPDSPDGNKVAPAQMAGAEDNAQIGHRNLKIKIRTDRVKMRHAMIVIVNPDLDRPDMSDSGMGIKRLTFHEIIYQHHHTDKPL
jgi:hypothetical protein